MFLSGKKIKISRGDPHLIPQHEKVKTKLSKDCILLLKPLKLNKRHTVFGL